MWEYFSGKAEHWGVGLSKLLTEVLKRNIEISEAGFVSLGPQAAGDQTGQNRPTTTTTIPNRSPVRQTPSCRGRLVHKLGPRKFAEVHHLNILAIVARLGAKPLIRVESAASSADSATQSMRSDPPRSGSLERFAG